MAQGNSFHVHRKISERGFTLVETVVAVALSGIFVMTLASLLAQTTAMATNVQQELYAIAVAEVAIENAQNTPYYILKNYAANGTQSLQIYSNNDNSAVPRIPPLQFDLTKTDKTFGTINSVTGEVKNAQKWTTEAGNFFRGRIEETVTDVSQVNNFPSVRVDVEVFFSIGGKQSKHVERSTTIFDER